VKRVVYLAVAALVALLILSPIALAQGVDLVPGDDDPYSPEPNAVEVDMETLQQIAGQSLPKTGGPAVGEVILPAAALLVGAGVMAYAVLRRR
jgi:hypothetical protein